MLTSRLIDRPLRPMFAPGWHHDTQVSARQLSARLLCCVDLVAGLQSRPYQRQGSQGVAMCRCWCGYSATMASTLLSLWPSQQLRRRSQYQASLQSATDLCDQDIVCTQGISTFVEGP